jgi:hypothetical protein
MTQKQYGARFGKLAVMKGFLVAEQLQQALHEQVDDDLANRPHRVIGAICFAHGWMTPSQIEEILNIMSKSREDAEAQ